MPVIKQTMARILIVEDEPMIALTMEDLLVEEGFEVVGVVGKLDKALALIGSVALDAAIVDANLAGVSASPVATALAARGIPFIVLTGYSAEQLDGALSGALLMKKPCRPDQLVDTLKSIVFPR